MLLHLTKPAPLPLCRRPRPPVTSATWNWIALTSPPFPLIQKKISPPKIDELRQLQHTPLLPQFLWSSAHVPIPGLYKSANPFATPPCIRFGYQLTSSSLPSCSQRAPSAATIQPRRLANRDTPPPRATHGEDHRCLLSLLNHSRWHIMPRSAGMLKSIHRQSSTSSPAGFAASSSLPKAPARPPCLALSSSPLTVSTGEPYQPHRCAMVSPRRAPHN
jgi:hypothetical protein